MKKLAILFLLTAVIVSFTFAQVSLKADFGVANVNKGNKAVQDNDPGRAVDGTTGQIGVAEPTLVLIFAAAKSQELGPGKLGFEGAVGIGNYFRDTDPGKKNADTTANRWDEYQTGNGVAPTDDTYAGVTYGFGAGPGTLGFGVNYLFRGISETYMWGLEPGVSYTALPAGPITLGVGLSYVYKFNGISTDNADKTQKGAAFFRPYGDSYSQDEIKFWFDVDTAFGLYIKYQFNYGWGKDATGRASYARDTTTKYRDPTSSELQGQREITNIAYLYIKYKLGGLATIGLEVDDTGPGFRGGYVKSGSGSGYDNFNTETSGFTLKPRADFVISNLGFGVYLKITNVMPTNADEEAKFKPGVYVKYTL